MESEEERLARRLGLGVDVKPRSLSELTTDVENRIMEYCRQTGQSGDAAFEAAIGLVRRLSEQLEASRVDLSPVMAQLEKILVLLQEIKVGLSIQRSNADLEREVLERLNRALAKGDTS